MSSKYDLDSTSSKERHREVRYIGGYMRTRDIMVGTMMEYYTLYKGQVYGIQWGNVPIEQYKASTITVNICLHTDIKQNGMRSLTT